MASIEIKTISSVKSGNPDFEDLKIGDLFRYPGSVGSNYYMKIRQFSQKKLRMLSAFLKVSSTG